ncbi:CocE/NonD family hydrolase [Collimonas fungivorans]|uniref:CocE/NonD family hydrolase n=1 Tax=Collimonas fungivorans TaxID=158899 RepID=UPI0026EBF950|nr:CocE/NonD family hydrolase [Collimonas fungivorans]
MPQIGQQFDNSPTGTPYPKLATLYPGHDGPTVDDGMILPWLSSKRAPLKFTVMVQTRRDTDGDGKPDRMALRIVQPAEVADGLKTPVIVRPSPYYGNPNYLDYDTKSRGPFLGEDQYLRMGFTIIYSDSLGTYQSEGCASIMDGSERDASAAVVKWLANDAATKGFDEHGVEVRASWSTGHVAMEGVSYGGTLPTMAAATGVTGLEAIVPVDGISNAYDYFARYNGVVPDEDSSTALAPYVTTLTPSARKKMCEPNRLKLAADADDLTLAYNDFWKERNTLLFADKIKAATLIAHGQSDNNVKTKNSVQLYDTLYRHKKPVQLWFHSRDHDDPAWQKEWQKQILLWYTRYLFGVNNGVEKQPTYVRETPAGDKIAGDLPSPPDGDTGDTLVGHCGSGHSPRDCIPTGELLVKEETWPTTNKVSYYLRGDGTATGLLLTPVATDGAVHAPIAFKSTSNSGTFETQAMANAIRFAGTIRLGMTTRFKAKVANLKAYLLVDGKKVTWGWVNPRFYKNLERPETIDLDTDYKLSLEMMPRDFTVLPGSKISIYVQGYNADSSMSAQQIVLDVSQTTLEMPVVPRARARAVMKLN